MLDCHLVQDDIRTETMEFANLTITTFLIIAVIAAVLGLLGVLYVRYWRELESWRWVRMSTVALRSWQWVGMLVLMGLVWGLISLSLFRN